MKIDLVLSLQFVLELGCCRLIEHPRSSTTVGQKGYVCQLERPQAYAVAILSAGSLFLGSHEHGALAHAADAHRARNGQDEG